MVFARAYEIRGVSKIPMISQFCIWAYTAVLFSVLTLSHTSYRLSRSAVTLTTIAVLVVEPIQRTERESRLDKKYRVGLS